MGEGHPSCGGKRHIALGIGNLRQVAAAYGEAAAGCLFAETRSRLQAALGGAFLDGAGGAVWNVHHDVGPCLGPVLADIAARPVDCDGAPVHALLAELDGPGHELPWFGAERYRGDMASTASVFGDLLAEEPVVAWQAVHHTGNSDRILYRECLLRSVGPDGAIKAPVGQVEAMERTGLVRALDRQMLLRVLNELEGAADRDIEMGVNISAQSARCDDWWDDIVARLTSKPDLGRRLVIEITETSPLPPITSLMAFARRMRKLGCRIAIDDFGTGYASIRQLITLRPDIVKIDAMFVRGATLSSVQQEMLVHLVGVAKLVAPVVIVEGVETEAHSITARDAGGTWQQGFIFGKPSIIRNWRSGQAASSKKSKPDALVSTKSY